MEFILDTIIIVLLASNLFANFRIIKQNNSISKNIRLYKQQTEDTLNCDDYIDENKQFVSVQAPIINNSPVSPASIYYQPQTYKTEPISILNNISCKSNENVKLLQETKNCNFTDIVIQN